MSSTQVIDHLTNTATDKGAPGRDQEYGFGVLNIVKALSTTPASASASASPSAGPTTSLQVGPTTAPSTPDKKSNTVLWAGLGTALLGAGLATAVLVAIVLLAVFSRRRSANR